MYRMTTWSLYVLSLLTNHELASVEEHLLVCPGCVVRLQSAERFTRTIR
jgi:hypothetical protein